MCPLQDRFNLDPFPPRPLRRFIGTMDHLTPGRSSRCPRLLYLFIDTSSLKKPPGLPRSYNNFVYMPSSTIPEALQDTAHIRLLKCCFLNPGFHQPPQKLIVNGTPSLQLALSACKLSAYA